jgi:hypothetical protein
MKVVGKIARGSVGFATEWVFSTTTTNSDPGSGNMRLDSTTQSAVLTLRLSPTDMWGMNWGAVFADLANVTGTRMGYVRLSCPTDPTKTMLLLVTAATSAITFWNITVSATHLIDAPTPFAAGDMVTVSFGWSPRVDNPMTTAGDIITGDTGGSQIRLALGARGSVMLAGATAPIWEPMARKNLLANGDQSLYQRVASGTNVASLDMTYQTTDRWKTVWDSAGTAWNLSAAAAGPIGSTPRCDRMLSTGNGSKIGKMQILTGRDTNGLISQAVSLQSKINANASISDVRMALLSWSGAVDAPTDPVAVWNAAGTNPTLAASWAYVNSPVNLNPVVSWVAYKVENQVVPANCQNLAVLIWCEDTANTSGEAWQIAEVQLELGTVCTAYEREPWAANVARCLHHCRKTYPIGTAPGSTVTAGEILAHAGNALAASTAGNVVPYCSSGTRFDIPMHHTPTVTVYNATSGVAGSARIAGVSDRPGCTAGGPSMTCYFEYLAFTNVSAVAIGDRNQIQLQALAEAEL